METNGERVRRGWRSRWAAVGAAVAVSLGAGGGFLIADAANGPESGLVMVDPLRILDTRDPVDLGLRGPFVSPIAQKLQVTGPVPIISGTKTVVPPGASGVLLNVTAVNATSKGFISIRPGDAFGPPSTSSLNVTVVGAPIPNAVQVALPTTGANAGKIDITWDALGIAGPTTDLLIDVVGYTVDLYSKADIDAKFAELEATAENNQTIMASASVRNAPDPGDGVNSTVVILATVEIVAPVDGTIQVVGSHDWKANSVNEFTFLSCGLWYGAGLPPSEPLGLKFTGRILKPFPDGERQGLCTSNGAIEVTAGTHVLNLGAFSYNDVKVGHATLDAVFSPGGSVKIDESLNLADSD
jgi:hypothetical protein